MGDKGFGEFGMDESGWLSGVMDRLGAQLLSNSNGANGRGTTDQKR